MPWFALEPNLGRGHGFKAQSPGPDRDTDLPALPAVGLRTDDEIEIVCRALR